MANIQIMDTKAVVQFDCLGTPTHYRIGETSDLIGSTWFVFENPELIIEYNLSDIKTYNLFAQVKNSVMESNIKSVVVDRLDDYVTINLKVIILDSGNTETNTNNIPVVLQYDGTPTQYKYALNPTLINSLVDWSEYTWIDYILFPSTFYIGGTDGNKNLYFLLKDSRDATSELNNNIMYYAPVAPTLTGADFLENTINKIVTITPTYSGIVTQYSCEKTGQPLIWHTFESPSFDITLDTEGLNSYSIVLKNTYGQSTSYNISITYTPLTFDIDEVIINNGDAETSSTTLSVNVSKIGTDDIAYYRIGLNPDLSSLEWLPYNSFPVNYNIAKPTQSVGVGIYAQIKGTTGLESQVKFDTIYYVYTDSVTVKVIGSMGAGNLLFEDKTYTYDRISNSSDFKVYDYDTAEELIDWRIMNDAETISEFGSAGVIPGNNTSNTLINTPYYYSHFGYSYSSIINLYWGLYLPNGTYNVSYLFSSDSEWGNLNDGKAWIINGISKTLPAISIVGNTTWVEANNIIVTDGKLKLEFNTTLTNRRNGFNGITIQKIA